MNANHGIEGKADYTRPTRAKCDRCGVTFGLLRHDKGYRCTQCIWEERVDIIKGAEALIKSIHISERNLREKTVTISRQKMDALYKAVVFARREADN